MTRILSHYFSRQMLRKAAFDLSFPLLSTFAVFLAFAERIDQLMPQAGGPMLSVAAGLFVVNTASGFYQRNNQFTLFQAFSRAAVAVSTGLPLGDVRTHGRAHG